MSVPAPDPDELRRRQHQFAKAGARYYSCMGWLLAFPLLFALAVVVVLLLVL